MEDEGRCNVAFTRAKEVFWIIGGEMSYLRSSRAEYDTPSLLGSYKWEMEGIKKNNRHKFKLEWFKEGRKRTAT